MEGKPKQLSEFQEQALFVQWLSLKNIRHYAIPNGGRKSIGEAVKLKRMGVSPGAPDLCIPIPRKCYHGLYIELKREKHGTASPQQVEWLYFLAQQGYCAKVAHGFCAAKAIVEDYFCMNNGNVV
jgi:hypothetical protein